jgi:hypothetical protein
MSKRPSSSVTPEPSNPTSGNEEKPEKSHRVRPSKSGRKFTGVCRYEDYEPLKKVGEGTFG